MRSFSRFSALAALALVRAEFETTYHSSSLAIQPFTILSKSHLYDPDNTTLFLTCPAGPAVAQPGPAIYKSTGELVWADPTLGSCNDLNYQTWEGQQYLTMWVGTGSAATGQQTGMGNGIMLNSNYETVKNVSAINPPYGTDLHEFNIVQPTGKTALVTALNTVQVDLTSVGGLVDGWYVNDMIQEIDIASGNVLFNWSSVDHIGFNESYNTLTSSGSGTSASNPWDAVHINSIDKARTGFSRGDLEGNYLISSRHCQTIYKIDKNGNIVWRLGGKMSNFTAKGDDTEFHWQHHVRWRTAETQISVFDDGAAELSAGGVPVEFIDEPVATGKYLDVDQKAMTVSLAKRYFPSPSTFSNFSLAEGSVEQYGNTILVGYGANPWVQAYDNDSESILFSAIIGPNDPALWTGALNNYRVFQTSTLQFTGHPTAPPNVSITGDDIYVSWNGATHVASYNLLTGSSVDAVTTKIASVLKSGFEMHLSAAGSSDFISVAALAANGTTLGTSTVYKVSDGSVAK
ncbi:ASST-domain-containing protein [Mycena rebaudengoi]|nr:ASST-domain-containing protein [Mycena rebaudengoi]